MMNCKWLMAIVLSGALFANADEPLDQRARRLSNMSATEKQSLRQQQQRFEQLATAEQEKLRRLDAELTADSQNEQLRSVMRSYSQWLRALPSSQRLELLSLDPSERVQRIKLLLEEQEHDRFKELFGSKLQTSDQKVLLEWVHGLIARDEDRILKQLSSSNRQKLNHIQDTTQRRVMMAIMFRWKSGDIRLFDMLKPTNADIKQLANELSPVARDTLEAARDKEREQLIQMWARAVIDSRIRPQASRDELQRFFREHLTDEQRAYLESLPRERMRMELQRMYAQHRFKTRSSRPGPPFSRPGGPRRPGTRRPDLGGRQP